MHEERNVAQHDHVAVSPERERSICAVGRCPWFEGRAGSTTGNCLRRGRAPVLTLGNCLRLGFAPVLTLGKCLRHEATPIDAMVPVARDPVVVSVTAPRAGGAIGREAPAPPAVTENAAPAQGAEAPAKEGGDAPSAPLDFIVRTRGRQMIKPGVDKLLEHVTQDPERLADLYAVDARGRVLLKKLPAATQHQLRNTVLLLLYGGLTMCGETSERGYRLVQAVRGMGLRIGRGPREFGPGGELSITFGRHRGKRYRLTAGGIRYCEQLIPGLLRALRH